MAKRMIKLINSVGEAVNSDPDVNRPMKVVFVPNYDVKLAHRVYPAANLSEQISPAGKEASGTGNMKFVINGALTIGTLDGANVEMLEEAGEENFFVFGLNEEEVARVYAEGHRPSIYIERDPELAEVQDLIAAGISPAVTPRSCVRSSIHCGTMIRSWCSPTTAPTWVARLQLTTRGRTRTHGLDVDPQRGT